MKGHGKHQKQRSDTYVDTSVNITLELPSYGVSESPSPHACLSEYDGRNV
jgi:hypothetical protein